MPLIRPNFILSNAVRLLANSVGTTRFSTACIHSKLGNINHIAIAVPDIHKAKKFYSEGMGVDCSEIQHLPEHGVSTVFVRLGETKIELITPLGQRSPIESFLAKNKDGGLHHVCIDVDDIEESIQEVRNNNIRTLTPSTKIGAHGKPVIFLHPKDCNGVLLELQQK